LRLSAGKSAAKRQLRQLRAGNFRLRGKKRRAERKSRAAIIALFLGNLSFCVRWTERFAMANPDDCRFRSNDTDICARNSAMRAAAVSCNMANGRFAVKKGALALKRPDAC
jgi:hypothetical protein